MSHEALPGHKALPGHTCNIPSFLPDKASWLMQGPQRERHAHKKTKPKQRQIIVQSWRGTVPAGFEWTVTLAAGRYHYLFGEHDCCMHVALSYPARACG